MRHLFVLGALLLASIVLYVGVFSVVHRPLTIGDIARQLDHKSAYARTLAGPKLVIFAGSNGRYSHRCEPMAAPLGRPCVNLSIGVGIGLDFLLDQVRPLLAPGDIVYMPLEYQQYTFSKAEMDAMAHNATLVHDRREQLWQLPLARIVRSHAHFDLNFLIQGVAEMALARGGVRRRASTDSLTPQGDESGHTAQAGRAYGEFLHASRYGPIRPAESSHSIDVLQSFLRDARERGVTVVGGLPTAPLSAPVSDAVVDGLRRVYEGQGQRFLVLDQRSQYPLHCFFDTLSHLHEGCQIEHSARVGAALATLDLAHGRPVQAP
jgi:hypothetical protein